MTNTDKSTDARIKWLLIAGSVFVAVSAFLLVWIPYQRQMRLIEEIEGVGGEVETGRMGGWVTPLEGWALVDGREWQRGLLERIRGLDTIYSVRLDDVPIDDSCLKRLGRLSSLISLTLNGTRISDDGLEHLAGLSELEVLYLGRTPVSDDGLKSLAGMTNLRWLSLDGTQISDDGLNHLAGLTTLQYLFLDGTRVSDDGVKKLQQALPDCEIEK